jgi:hypothetical protein
MQQERPPPFSLSWNSTTKANGAHTLMVKAYDAAGNSGSASVSVNARNLTSTSLLQIHADATEVTGTHEWIHCDASHPAGGLYTEKWSSRALAP